MADAGPAESLTRDLLLDRTRSRRWAVVRTAFICASIVFSTYSITTTIDRANDQRSRKVSADINGDASSAHLAVVRMSGPIGPDERVSFESMADTIRSAFRNANARAVALVINSPGGTPVQSALLYDELRAQRALHPTKPLFAVIEDVGASGAYFVASAADTILANRSSLVGSIGVIHQSLGLGALATAAGVESRLVTSGEHKARFNPLSEWSEGDRQKMAETLGAVHEHFKEAVRAGRLGKLKGDESELFSGDIWTGDQAVALGLADALGSVETARASIDGDVGLVEYAPPVSFVDRVGRVLGAQVATQVVSPHLYGQYQIR